MATYIRLINYKSRYETFRDKIIQMQRIDIMVHLGARAFEEIDGEVIQSVAFVLEKVK